MVVDDLAQMLIEDGVGTLAPSGNIWKYALPATPDDAFCLYATGGSPADMVMERAGPAYEHPAVQVVARSKTATTAETNIQAAYDSLSVVGQRYANGVRYLRITPLQPPFYLMRDENQRFIFAFNVEAVRAV